MPGWASLKSIVEIELTQSSEEGKDPAAIDAIRSEWAALDASPACEPALAALHAKLLELPVEPFFAFREPDDLPGIHALRPSPAPALPAVDTNRLPDALHGAWLGRCVGCALGKPYEVMGMATSPGTFQAWQRIKTYLTAIDPAEWPIRDYAPPHSPAEAQTGKVHCPASCRGTIDHMETDDDIRYTVLGHILMQRHGRDLLSTHVAKIWFTHLGYAQVCTAETQAYRNMVIRDATLRSHPPVPAGHDRDSLTDWHWIVHHLNPYREWIGAQIRVDAYGYACPGLPELAAQLAWRDARISHSKNGIYGAMFCAAIIAAAFATSDVAQIIRAGLAQIPSTSRLYQDIEYTLQLCARHNNAFDRFEDVFESLHQRLGHYSPVHTNNNAALCVAALLLSGGDFARAITLAVMGGWDTDCNGATVGSVVGAIAGASGAPAHWTTPLNDTLRSFIPGYHPIAISECARRSLPIAEKILSGA